MWRKERLLELKRMKEKKVRMSKSLLINLKLIRMRDCLY